MLYCKGRKVWYGADGYDYECGYEHGEISCEDCIMTGGDLSPQTGKKFRGNLQKYQDFALKKRANLPEYITLEIKFPVVDDTV